MSAPDPGALDYVTERCRHGAHEVTGDHGQGECQGYVIDPTTANRRTCTCPCHFAEPVPDAGAAPGEADTTSTREDPTP